MRWGEFKPLLADALVAHLDPIQKRYYYICVLILLLDM